MCIGPHPHTDFQRINVRIGARIVCISLCVWCIYDGTLTAGVPHGCVAGGVCVCVCLCVCVCGCITMCMVYGVYIYDGTLTAGVPHGCVAGGGGRPQTVLDVVKALPGGGEQVPEQSNVGDGEPQCVDLRQALLWGRQTLVLCYLKSALVHVTC